jgi:hypothetical protein
MVQSMFQRSREEAESATGQLIQQTCKHFKEATSSTATTLALGRGHTCEEKRLNHLTLQECREQVADKLKVSAYDSTPAYGPYQFGSVTHWGPHGCYLASTVWLFNPGPSTRYMPDQHNLACKQASAQGHRRSYHGGVARAAGLVSQMCRNPAANPQKVSETVILRKCNIIKRFMQSPAYKHKTLHDIRRFKEMLAICQRVQSEQHGTILV